MRLVVPKLQSALKTIEIDPAEQKLETLEAVFEWDGIVDNKTMVQMVRENVMTKWLSTLEMWLE